LIPINLKGSLKIKNIDMRREGHQPETNNQKPDTRDQ